MRKLLMIAALGCTATGFANYGNQGYYNNQSQGYDYSQNQPYYQSQGTTYYQTQPQTQFNTQNDPYFQTQGYQQQQTATSNGYGYISTSDMPTTTTTTTTPSFSTSNDARFQNQTATTGQFQTKGQDFAATEQDKLINTQIRDRLSNLGLRGYETIILRTQNGIVMISGSVDKVDDLMKIRDQIKNIDGVKSVNNQVTAKNR